MPHEKKSSHPMLRSRGRSGQTLPGLDCKIAQLSSASDTVGAAAAGSFKAHIDVLHTYKQHGTSINNVLTDKPDL
jgi:hypothetical protein